MTAHAVFALALLVAAIGCALFAVLGFASLARLRRGARTLDHALDQRASNAAAAAAAAARAATLATSASRESGPAQDAKASNEGGRGRRGPHARFIERLSHAAMHFLDTRFGAFVVAPEDRRLLERCGFLSVHARARFFAARLGCGALLPLLVFVLREGDRHLVMWLGAALAIGFMLPKWLISSRAKGRQRAVAGELPMFVDLLRLLQGVGLSLDQSLQVMINDFSSILPVLSKELALAHRQFTSGRTREQSLNRLATSYENDDLNAVMRLVVQVDKHGGAVQEPLRQFGDRLRETRRATLRQRIGTLTVKMTGVMALTLLPALLIVTAGPGFIAVFHALTSVHK